MNAIHWSGKVNLSEALLLNEAVIPFPIQVVPAAGTCPDTFQILVCHTLTNFKSLQNENKLINSSKHRTHRC